MNGNAARSVTELCPEEPARFNPEKLEKLCRQIGEARAEVEVARALERISEALATLPKLSRADPAQLRVTACVLVRDADLIGMATLARVAHHVIEALDQGDAVALTATTARLMRVGDRSIHAVWELEDLSG
jgi:hypothetical protein